MRGWRDAATLIIAAKNGVKNSQSYDYRLLFLKRNKNAKFPGAFVFPGGVTESADANLKWQDLFKQHGYNDSSFKSLLPNVQNRPSIFQSRENELPREISLRITAIRETFEESGILFCKSSLESSTDSKSAHHFPIAHNELKNWQTKVHHDANEFYNMCEQFHCHPNLWALHEWRNWLGGTFLPPPKRFDSVFFFVSMPQIPNSNLELNEMDDLIWTTPEVMMMSYKTSLLPPQRYELTKIGKHKTLDSLINYALKIEKDGIQFFLTVKVELLDGLVILLPGDPMYPEKVDLYEKVIIDKKTMTIKQFRDMTSNTHRIEIFKDSESKDDIFSKL